MLVDDPEHQHARAKFVQEEGARWEHVHAAAFAKLPEGTAVVINIVTGEYVTGADCFEAREAFQQKFGKGRTMSWSFVKGRPIFVGGGLWRS